MAITLPYSEEILDVKVSDCPYCGCKRVVKHVHDDDYEEPDDYFVEHAYIKDAADCFAEYFAFRSIEEAVRHADARAERTCRPDGKSNEYWGMFICSECGYFVDTEDDCGYYSMGLNDREEYDYEQPFKMLHYCPNCGAKVVD